MKKLIVLLALIPCIAQAQLLDGKNVIKMNLSSITLRNYHFIYERGLGKKTSLSIGYRFMPKGDLPLKRYFEDELDNEADVNLNGVQISNWAITPEFRYYFGKGVRRGFYLAPYMRFASFNLSTPVRYTSSAPGNPSYYADFAGKLTSVNGGLMLGVQYTVFKNMVIDFWIAGAHYGGSNGDLNATFNPPLTPTEVASLQATLNDMDKIGPFSFEGRVSPDGKSAYMKTTGPWAGVRGLGLNIGFRF